MSTGTTALTVQQRAAIALSSSKAEAELIELAGQSKSIINITNKDGREECHSAAMTARAARVAVEKAGKAAREDATAFGKAVIAEENRLVDLIAPEETRLIGLRDQWDAKVKAEKEAKEATERARIAAIKDKIELIKRGVTNAALLDAAGAKSVLDLTQELIIDDSYAEFYGEAMEARGETITKLREIVAAKQEAEATAARIKAEQKAEAERLRIEREATEAQAAELRRQQEEIDRQRREFEADRRTAEASAPAATQPPEPVATKAPEPDPALMEKPTANPPAMVPPAAASNDEPLIKLGEICAALGFTVTADFVASLGIHPVKTEKAAKLYPASALPRLCVALQEHLTRVIQKTICGKAA